MMAELKASSCYEALQDRGMVNICIKSGTSNSEGTINKMALHTY